MGSHAGKGITPCGGSVQGGPNVTGAGHFQLAKVLKNKNKRREGSA